MIHPHTELRHINDEIGFGVVATQFIPKGTIVWAIDEFDRIFDPKYIEDLEDIYKKIVDTYCYRNRYGEYVLCWDHARFINHSFFSNCLTTAYEFELAIRDIHPGEQLTDDYGYLNLDEPFEPIPERGAKRTHVMPDDILRYHKQWDKKIAAAFMKILTVDQPVLPVIKKEVKEKIMAIIKEKAQIDSILTCYYKRNGENLLMNEFEPTR